MSTVPSSFPFLGTRTGSHHRPGGARGAGPGGGATPAGTLRPGPPQLSVSGSRRTGIPATPRGNPPASPPQPIGGRHANHGRPGKRRASGKGEGRGGGAPLDGREDGEGQ